VGDFGISKVLSGTVDKASTIIGTPLYLSPELLQSKDYNQASDIWALGILLYEMIALRTPWTESNLVQLGVSICSSKYPEEPL
jgi:NIMA (never in mitosis gene a)-related kinase 1/4/5